MKIENSIKYVEVKGNIITLEEGDYMFRFNLVEFLAPNKAKIEFAEVQNLKDASDKNPTIIPTPSEFIIENDKLVPIWILSTFGTVETREDYKSYRDGSSLTLYRKRVKVSDCFYVEITTGSRMQSSFKQRTLKSDDNYGSSMCMDFYDYTNVSMDNYTESLYISDIVINRKTVFGIYGEYSNKGLKEYPVVFMNLLEKLK